MSTSTRKLLTEFEGADLFGAITGGDTFAVKKPQPDVAIDEYGQLVDAVHRALVEKAT